MTERGFYVTLPADFDAMLKEVSGMCDTIMEVCGEVAPFWCIDLIGDGKKVLVQPTSWRSWQHKAAVVETMKELFAITRVKRMLMVSEAWSVVETGDEAAAAKLMEEWPAERSLEEHPKAKEIVMLHAEERGGRNLIARRCIERGSGKPVLGPLMTDDWMPAKGRMAKMLEDPA